MSLSPSLSLSPSRLSGCHRRERECKVHLEDENQTVCCISNYGLSTTAVLVTHPWGPLGGNRHNNVVVAAVLYFSRMGFVTCRFDFVPHEWISPGHAQVQQVQQIAQLLLQGSPTLDRYLNPEEEEEKGEAPTALESKRQRPRGIILVGYSYGSLITGSASAGIPACVATIAIAPPFGVAMWLLSFQSNRFLKEAASRTDLHRLFVIGDCDNFTSQALFRSQIQKFCSSSSSAAILKDADHFFRHREKDLMTVIGRWLKMTFPQCQGDLKRLAQLDLPHYNAAASSSLTSTVLDCHHDYGGDDGNKEDENQ